MYKYSDIKQLHLEPSSRCQAACPMCARNQQGGKTRENILIGDITLDLAKEWFPEDFIKNLNKMYMCGNFGDPILNTDALHIFQYFRDVNPDIELSMNTNGSARPHTWWRDLADIGVTVRFGIDGTDAVTHALYRRHTDLNKILQNAQYFIERGGEAVWDMLVFKHNEHQVEEAQDMAFDYGFSKFVSKATSRFKGDDHKVLDELGRHQYSLAPSDIYPPKASKDQFTDEELENCPIDCKVKKDKEVYVSATGLVFPCCWTAQFIHERAGLQDSYYGKDPSNKKHLDRYFDFMHRIGVENIDLHNRTLQEIVDNYWQEYEKAWEPGPNRLTVCSRFCGYRQPFESQFLEEHDLPTK